MLTDQDLKKIGEMMDGRFGQFGREVGKRFDIFGREIDEKMDKRFGQFSQEMDEKMDKRFGQFGREIDEKMDKLKPIKGDITHIRKDIKMMIGFFDKEYLDLRKRVERIEGYLKLAVS